MWKFSLSVSFILTSVNSDEQVHLNDYSTISLEEIDSSQDYINMSIENIANDNSTFSVIFEGDKATFWWQDLLNYSQLCMLIFGFFANITTVVTLFKNGSSFSSAILILLRHQSAADATTCFFSTILIVQPDQPHLSGFYILDNFICFFWHSQAMYFSCLLVSIWNLVLLAFERYLAVCHPFKHQELTAKRVRLMILGIYIFVAAMHWPNYFQASLSDGVCKIVNLHQSVTWLRIQYYFAVSGFFYFYVFPCLLFILLYGRVLLSLYQRRREAQLSASRIIDKAKTELTKTAITVTVIFIITMGLNVWYFLLGTVGLIDMIFYGVIHMISIWLASLNSTANPFVYSLLMPVFRSSVLKTFCFRK